MILGGSVVLIDGDGDSFFLFFHAFFGSKVYVMSFQRGNNTSRENGNFGDREGLLEKSGQFVGLIFLRTSL